MTYLFRFDIAQWGHQPPTIYPKPMTKSLMADTQHRVNSEAKQTRVDSHASTTTL